MSDKNQKGATRMEYALIIVAIAVAVIATAYINRVQIQALFADPNETTGTTDMAPDAQ
jgi:Flp pilus assembly pilin Flp